MPISLPVHQELELGVAYRAVERVVTLTDGRIRELLDETLENVRVRLFTSVLCPPPAELIDRLIQLHRELGSLEDVSTSGCAASAGSSLALAAVTTQVSNGAESVIVSAADAYGFYRGDERRGISYAERERFMDVVKADRMALEGADRVPQEFIFERSIWPN